MTLSLTLALAFVIACGAILFSGGNGRQALAFAIVAAAMFPASLLPLGHAAPWKPYGEFTVLGARIDVEEAIWVLLDDGSGPPRYYKLPYSVAAANNLQAALDGAAEGDGTAKMKMGEDGSPGFFEEVPPPEPEKTARERAVLD